MKHCRALAFAFSLGFAPIVVAQEGLQIAYNAVLTDYGFLMSKAEFCDLSTRFSLKYDVLTTLAGKMDLLRVESDLDQAHRAERDRLPDDCQPDDVSLWARSFERSLDMLVAVIENGGNYPDTPRRTCTGNIPSGNAPIKHQQRARRERGDYAGSTDHSVRVSRWNDADGREHLRA